MSDAYDAAAPERLDLEDMPIASLPEIVGTGTTVYRVKRTSSKHWDLAVKFKWLPPDTDPAKWPCEGRMIRLVKERYVWGVVRLLSHNTFETVETLRKGRNSALPGHFAAERNNTGKCRPQSINKPKRSN